MAVINSASNDVIAVNTAISKLGPSNSGIAELGSRDSCIDQLIGANRIVLNVALRYGISRKLRVTNRIGCNLCGRQRV